MTQIKRKHITYSCCLIIILLMLLGCNYLAPTPTPDETEEAAYELHDVQAAVKAMMVDNGLSTLPNPVTSPTNDMCIFPDTSICGVHKIQGPDGNLYIRGYDKDGYCLHTHDLYADGSESPTVDYVATRYTKGIYVVNSSGTVTQVTTGF